ncbi:Aldo/keto reductase [Xylariaceae sp. FL0255]|nr:Aldo/keto reductase [Xylariaceae sp. FL0255]
MTTPPRVIAGTGTWGHNIDAAEAERQMNALKVIGVNEIDTAAVYPFSKPTTAEQIIGSTGLSLQDGCLIDTKIMWFDMGKCTLTKENIANSINESLARLKVEKFHILYAIGPDSETPLEEQAAAFDSAYCQGKFEKLGICNFSAEMFKEYVEIAESKGFVKPSVFQGQYNLLCRTYEETLVTFFRQHGVSLYAFSPLAQGTLTGKLTFAKNPEEDLKGTRFDLDKNNIYGLNGRRWYDKPSFHNAIRQMTEFCKPFGIDTTDAAMRWLLHHSVLDGVKGDGIIIGPRNKEQTDKAIESVQAGPLPQELAEKVDALWGGVADDAASILVY